MGTVTKHNFSSILPELKEAILSCDFVALDLEFTGLQSAPQYEPSYFDSPTELYQKLRNRASKFTVLQVGLAIFTSMKDKCYAYNVRVYNVFVFPTSVGSVNTVFCCQTSSLDFLRKHNFDFNKCVGDGVGFLNECQEAIAKSELEANLCFYGIESITDVKATQALCSKVSAWLASAEDESTFIYDKSKEEGSYPNCVLHELLKQRFPNVWPCPSSEENVVLKKLSKEARAQLEAEMITTGVGLKDDILSKAVGFSQVIRLVSSARKPIIGHNMLTDLMFVHEKFFKTLPATYEEFKRSIKQLFPVIIDTKHLASVIKKDAKLRDVVSATALDELHLSLEKRPRWAISLFQPIVILLPGSEHYDSRKQIHEAGYDAFMCGAVFLQLAHLLTMKNIKSSSAEPQTFGQYLHQLRPIINMINAARCTVTHVNLSGADPPTYRPPLLYLRLLKGSQPRLTMQEAVTLLSAYGSLDFRMESKDTALIAVGNAFCERSILTKFYNDRRLLVTRYRFWYHSKWAERIVWAGLTLMTAGCIYYIVRS